MLSAVFVVSCGLEAHAATPVSEISLRMENADGAPLGTGTVQRSREGNGLRIRTRYELTDHSRIDEEAAFLLEPHLVQQSWSWRQTRDGKLLRSYSVDFGSGQATGLKWEKGKKRTWNEHLSITPGRTFAGAGFALALEGLRDEVREGPVRLKAVAMTPKPRVVPIQLKYAGREAGEHGAVDHFVIHPSLGVLLQAIAHPPDFDLWLSAEEKPSLVSVRGLLLEPSDPVIRLRLQAGGQGSSF
jgi:hypothetical protein